MFVLKAPVVSDYPPGTDVALAIEACDTTQDRDFGAKSRLYARAGVAEYWVLDMARRTLVAFRDSDGEIWRVRLDLAEGDSIAPGAAPGSPVSVAALLP